MNNGLGAIGIFPFDLALTLSLCILCVVPLCAFCGEKFVGNE